LTARPAAQRAHARLPEAGEEINTRGADSTPLNARIVVGHSGESETTAPGSAALAGGEDPGATEEAMMSEAIERGKRSGHAARARRRAERAIEEGRTPGKPGPRKAPEHIGRILSRVRRLIVARDPAALAVLRLLLPEEGDLR
jgi:hypothetical protein